MAQLTLRNVKGAPITFDEMDSNLLALDSDSPWRVYGQYITYNKKVGIGPGAIAPTYHLDFGDGDPSNEATIGTQDADLHVHVDGARKFKVTTNSQERLTLTTQGNLGIGQPNPEFPLDIDGNARITGTFRGNQFRAYSFSDSADLTISNGNITNAKRIVSTEQIDFTQFYDRSTGYVVDHIDSVIVNDAAGFPTTSAVYDVEQELQNNLDLLVDSLNNHVSTINGQFDSLNGKLQTNLNIIDGQFDSLNGKLQTNLNIIDGQFDSLNAKLETNLNIIDGQFDSLNGKLQSNVNILQGNINNLENSLSSTSLQDVTDVGSTTTNSITANSFIKSGGTSSQYLKADGSTSTDADMSAGSLANSFTVQGTVFDGSLAKTVTFTGGTGITVSGTTITNDLGGTPVSITGGGATTVGGSYPAFTISSTNTTYTAGTGLSLSGTQFTNTAPDRTVSITGSGATTVTGTYPNFTISSTDTDNNTTYSAGTGLSLSGTTFTNTAPDKTVVLTGAGGLTVSGTYPNFTLTQGSVAGYTLPLASSSTRGGVKIGYSTSGKNYAVQLSSEKMYVNVPWTDNNTTYTAGNGLSLAGTEFKMSGSFTGTLTCTGDVVAFSDAALKSDIRPIENALDRLREMGGYTFLKQNDTDRRTGVLAQEIQKVLPEAVHTSEDGTLGVAYGNLIGLLIEAIKELESKLDK